jgi:hypothetical protein
MRNPAMIFDFQQARFSSKRPIINLAEAQARIERCALWLSTHDLRVLGFVGSSVNDPVVVVAAHPKVWALFSGRAYSKGHTRDGALRAEVWEGVDRINHVNVRWQEVSACA